MSEKTEHEMGLVLLDTYLGNALKALPKLDDVPKKRRIRKLLRKAQELVHD